MSRRKGVDRSQKVKVKAVFSVKKERSGKELQVCLVKRFLIDHENSRFKRCLPWRITFNDLTKTILGDEEIKRKKKKKLQGG